MTTLDKCINWPCQLFSGHPGPCSVYSDTTSERAKVPAGPDRFTRPYTADNGHSKGVAADQASRAPGDLVSMRLPSKLATCPFCNATPHHGLTPIEYDQLHGDPFQRYAIWCPHGHARIIEMDKSQAFAVWGTRFSLQNEVRP